MKILIIGDVHFGDHTNKDIEKEQLNAAKQIQKWKEDNTDGYLHSFFCGDIIHNASKITTSQLEAEEICFGGGLNFSISGNHDQENDNFFDLENDRLSSAKTYINHSKTFNNLDNDYEYLGDNTTVYGIPFYRNASGFYKVLGQLVENYEIGALKDHKSILIIHQTPNTTAFSENSSDTIDINHDLFKPFNLVFCGHIHEPKKLNDNFYQTGALIPLNRNEAGTKYFYVVDTKTLEVESIPLKQDITFTQVKKKIKENVSLSEKVSQKSKDFDLKAETLKAANKKGFTKEQKNWLENQIIKKI